MPMNKLQAMQVFVRVVETGGITRAADSLRMPKATATTLIQQLEAELGVKLRSRGLHTDCAPSGPALFRHLRLAILSCRPGGAAASGRTDRAPLHQSLLAAHGQDLRLGVRQKWHSPSDVAARLHRSR